MNATELPLTAQAVLVTTTADADVIEVIATRSTGTQAIDRRTYQVQQSPQSEQKSATQLLRGLPAVTVTPEGEVLLLGSGNAAIYVDGHPYVGDARQYLRTLHGSDIERIEVLTNPSAQFSAEGTGGVINLVLRKNRRMGWSGNASLESSTYGYGLVDTTLHYKRGAWSYEVKAGSNIGTMGRWNSSALRSVEPATGGAATSNSQDIRSAYRGTVGRLSGKATYAADARNSVTLALGGGGGHDINMTRTDYRGITTDFASFSEDRRLDSRASFLTGELALDHRGAREREALTASAQVYTNPMLDDVTNARFTNGGAFTTRLRHPSTTIDTQAGWKHPMARGQLLALGATWHRDTTRQDYSLVTTAADGTRSNGAADHFDGSSETLAAYATFQQMLGAVTLEPGLRAERNVRQVAGASVSDELTSARLARTALFPSLHLQYLASRRLTFTASYSQRIERAPLDYLRSYAVVDDALTVFRGNPALRDQTTQAYEGSLQYRPGKIETNLTAFWRTTGNVWSTTYAVNAAGASVYGYVNAGRRRTAGAQFDLSAPLLRQVKITLSANLFDQRNPVETQAGMTPESAPIAHSLRATTSGTLEWTNQTRDSRACPVPGDVVQLQWSYNNPQHQYQIRNAPWAEVSLAWTHSFAKTLSLSTTLLAPGRTRQDLLAPLVQQQSWRQRRPQLQVKLVKTLG
ncbi:MULTISPECIES: TonB-dependent receptor [unclassified Sphingomonas]|uniref:TonB-dependent receptor n=1 Tax=Novosphingobium rhizosphaerae TaxID=1551649 RepID=UPI0015CA81A4